MTPKISIIIATVGAALVLGVPTAWGDNYFADRNDKPGLADLITAKNGVVDGVIGPTSESGSVAAKQNMLDARERGLGLSVGQSKVGPLEARERSFAAKQDAQLVSAQYPDWFERAAAAAIRNSREPVVDDRFRIDPTSTPAPVTVSSGRDIEWPQVGIGLGLGIVLMLGLYLGMKATRHRPLAH